jgi:hypothetical protein
LSSRAVEIFTDLAKGKNITDYRTAAELMQKAVRLLKEELRDQNLDCSMEQLHKYLRDNALDFSLMIASHHESKPYIFTINFCLGIATKANHPFIAIGCGSGLATYILSWFKIDAKMAFEHAIIAALYTIEEVKKVDPFCGGKTKFALLFPKMTIPQSEEYKTNAEFLRMMLQCEHDQYIDAIAAMDRQAKSEWANRMNWVLSEAHAKLKAMGNQSKSKQL